MEISSCGKNRKQKYFDVESEVLKILRIIANSHSGIMEFLYEQENLNILILSLDSPILSSRIAAAEFLLAIVTLEYPKGHGLVIAAFENFRIALNEHRLFEKLLKALYEIVSTRGIFGSVVGSRRDRLTAFLVQSEKNQEIEQQKEIKDFLVSSNMFRLIT